MGYSYGSPLEREHWRRQAAAEKGVETKRVNRKRMALADKIVLALVDRISADIIRPGPTPSERECYVVAQELRDHSPTLKALVTDILKVAETEPEEE